MLTDAKLRALKPRETLYRLADDKGLCVEVPITGARLWRLRYRYNGTAKMIGLGAWPEVSLADARRRRDIARALLASGTDPSVQRFADKEAAALTFDVLATEWLARRDQSEATKTKDAWLIDFAIAAFGSKSADAVTSADVLALLQSLEKRGLLETARRLRAKVSAVFRYGKSTQRLKADPTADLERDAIKAPKVKHHAAITDPKRVGELLRAIDAYTGGFIASRALRLAPLVFVRPGELRTAEWSEVDLDKAEWRIPAAKMKMGIEHIVPLSKQAVMTLREVHALTGRSRYVFPSARTLQRPLSENTVNASLRTMGYDSDTMTGHGFRTIASTLLHELGYATDVIERQLAHKEANAIKDAYNRAQHLPERITMMQAWADYLDVLRIGANVTPIRKHKAG
jgi:integrase